MTTNDTPHVGQIYCTIKHETAHPQYYYKVSEVHDTHMVLRNVVDDQREVYFFDEARHFAKPSTLEQLKNAEELELNYIKQYREKIKSHTKRARLFAEAASFLKGVRPRL